MSKGTKKQTKTKDISKRRNYIPQSFLPRTSLKEAIKLAQAINDDFGAKSAKPHQLAISLDISPTSSNWKYLCGSSMAYGLTNGGYNAKEISLTDLGKRVIAPTIEGDDAHAKAESNMLPIVIKSFFEKYDKAKFPRDIIAKNVLAEIGVPPNRMDTVLNIIKENGKYVGIITETKTGPFVALEFLEYNNDNDGDSKFKSDDLGASINNSTTIEDLNSSTDEESSHTNNRVFIAHGKNHIIVEQLKKILSFGKYMPVLSVEHETTAIPIPDKVIKDMQSCFAGILHVCSEKELIDHEGNKHHYINENVLIEIGAAMALYNNNFILLVQKGIKIPSNLQGLQRCEYEGEKLDVDATMKLLASFNEFK